MAKPIFLVGIIADHTEAFEQVQKAVESKLDDYHVLVHHSQTDELTFQVFYEKDFTEINYEELKQLIKESINKTSPD